MPAHRPLLPDLPRPVFLTQMIAPMICFAPRRRRGSTGYPFRLCRAEPSNCSSRMRYLGWKINPCVMYALLAAAAAGPLQTFPLLVRFCGCIAATCLLSCSLMEPEILSHRCYSCCTSLFLACHACADTCNVRVYPVGENGEKEEIPFLLVTTGSSHDLPHSTRRKEGSAKETRYLAFKEIYYSI